MGVSVFPSLHVDFRCDWKLQHYVGERHWSCGRGILGTSSSALKLCSIGTNPAELHVSALVSLSFSAITNCLKLLWALLWWTKYIQFREILVIEIANFFKYKIRGKGFGPAALCLTPRAPIWEGSLWVGGAGRDTPPHPPMLQPGGEEVALGPTQRQAYLGSVPH